MGLGTSKNKQMIQKSIHELHPNELRKIAELKEQIDLILNDSVIVTDGPDKPKPHWTKTPRGRKIMRRKMRARWRKGGIFNP